MILNREESGFVLPLRAKLEPSNRSDRRADFNSTWTKYYINAIGLILKGLPQDSVNSLSLDVSRRYRWPQSTWWRRILHWGRGWTTWYLDCLITRRLYNAKKKVGWQGLHSANQFHQNCCAVTWNMKVFFTNKTAFFPAQEFPLRNSLMLAPFKIVLWQHPRAWSKHFQTPSGLSPPPHPNTFPFANTH